MKTICIEAPTLAVTAEWEGHKSGNMLITKPSMKEKRVVFAPSLLVYTSSCLNLNF